MKKKIAISQSNYIPWKGYFDFISRVDEFVLYDDVQYTRRDWRNRNKIKMENGLKWLTIPVTAGYHDAINEVLVADSTWHVKHWNKIHQNYKNAPYYKEFSDHIKRLYQAVPSEKLSEINHHFLDGINRLLDIDTPLSWSMEYKKEGNKTERLISICKQAGADIYITGPSARNYMDVNLFNENDIEVKWMNYENYKPYLQMYGEFEHNVTILDLLFHTGRDARKYMRY